MFDVDQRHILLSIRLLVYEILHNLFTLGPLPREKLLFETDV